MKSIILINMPFASVRIPSLGLAQIKSVLDSEGVPGRSCRILYLNHDFAAFFGVDMYERIAAENNTGIGDWLFRQLVFPAAEENTQQYLRRFYPQIDEPTRRFKSTLLEFRSRLPGFFEKLVTRYDICAADIVGFTTMFQQNLASFAMAAMLKTKNPHLVTVMGGANCETPMGDVIVRNCEFIDYAISGSGLVSFPSLVRRLSSGQDNGAPRIPGVLERTSARTCARRSSLLSPSSPTAAHGEELDINTGIEPDYDDFLSSLADKLPDKEVNPVLTFETSRGCWWGQKCQCTFCGLNGHGLNYRAMRPDLAIRQFEVMFGYADRCSECLCVDNILPQNYINDVVQKLVVPKNVTITYEVRSALSLDELQALSNSNIRIIQPGIESLATSTLRLMKKGRTAFQNIQFLQNCLRARVKPIWNLLVGFPGEEQAVFERYVQFLPRLFHLPPPSGCMPVRFDRYSVYFEQPERYGLDLHPVEYYEYVYPWSKGELFELAYYFTDRNMGRSQYFNAMIPYYGALTKHAATWRDRWEKGNNSVPPQLVLVCNGQSREVIDTRAGTLNKYSLSPLGARILEQLNRPMQLNSLANEMTDVSVGELERELSGVVSNGLVFEENAHYLNLTTEPIGAASESGRSTSGRWEPAAGLASP